jgi:hypothetical protein
MIAEVLRAAMLVLKDFRWLPASKRPVDLLQSNPDAVIEAARRDAVGSAM